MYCATSLILNVNPKHADVMVRRIRLLHFGTGIPKKQRALADRTDSPMSKSSPGADQEAINWPDLGKTWILRSLIGAGGSKSTSDGGTDTVSYTHLTLPTTPYV